ncbi:hypothetical protein [Streptomyces sp. NPDC001508]|uniref:hypothetical protein n=1 Tax=Streptomyces sp. NPDC001508 TaxID=3154656 RepID=UPI00332A70C6
MTEQPPKLELRLEGFTPADEPTAEAFWLAIETQELDLVPLAEHHQPDGTASYYVLVDTAATWDHPGTSWIVALSIQRDPQARTFDFDYSRLPLPAMAQSWLIARGCPHDAIALLPDRMPAVPADEETRALEKRLMGDGDHFALLASYTCEEAMEIVVILRAIDEKDPSPFRVLHEQTSETDGKALTYTLREGGFGTYAEAVEWCGDRLRGGDIPLPPAQKSTRPTPAAAAPLSTAAQRPPGRSR